MTRKRLGMIAGTLAGVLGVALVVPALIEWNGYKELITNRIEARLGRKAAIDGPLTLALLPRPHLSASQVRLANGEGGAEPDMVRAASIELRLSPWALLAGRAEISSVLLQAPQIHLERLPGGHGNWQFQPPQKPAASPSAASEPAAPFSPKQNPPLPLILVEDGVLTYQTAGGHPLTLEAIDGRLDPDLDGPNRIAVKARLHGVALTVDGQMPSAGGEGAVRLTVGVERAASLTLDGHLSPRDGFSGKLQAKAAALKDLAAALGWPGLRLPAGGATLDGNLSADAQGLALENGTLTLAGATGTVMLQGDFTHGPQWDVALSFPSLDLDGWAASLPPASAPPTTALAPSADSASGPIPASPAPKNGGFSKALAINVDFSVDSLTLRGGQLHRARVNAALINGELQVNQAGVQLPGAGEVNLFGFFTPDRGGLAFDGTVEASADDLRGLLAWAALEPQGVAEDRLRRGGFSGKLTANRDGVKLDGGVVKLDGAKADLAADLRLGSGRPALGVSFAVDKLDLDGYRGHGKTASASPAVTEAKPAVETKTIQPAPAKAAWSDGIDANVKGKIGQLTAWGLAARDVAVDAGWVDGGLALRDLSSPDVAGAQIKLSGGLSGLRDGGLAFQHLRWELRSERPAKLLRTLVTGLPVDVDRLGPLALTGGLDGKVADALTLDSRNEVAGGQFDLSGRIEQPVGQPRLHLALEASHASLAQVIRLISPDYRPQASLGAFAASTRIEGGWDQLALSDLRLKLGPAAAAGEAKLALSGRPRIDLTLTAGEVPVDPFLPTKRQTDARPTLREQIESGLLIPTKGVPARHSGAVTNPDLPPPPASAPRPHVVVSGISEHWSSEPFHLEWMTTLDGTVKIDAGAVTWGQSRMDGPSLRLSLAQGALTLEQLTGQLWGGHLALSGGLSHDGAAKLTGEISHAQMHDALLSTAGLGVADGVMDGSLAVTAEGTSPAELVSRLNGSAKVAVSNGLVKGFDLKAVSDKAQALDNPLGLLALLQAGLSGGSTRFSSLTGTAKAKDGIIASDDLTLVAEGGGAKGQANVNLPGWVMDAHAAFHLASAVQAPPLVMRLTGPLDNPRRFIDINEIQTWLAGKGIGKSGPVKDAGKALGQMLNGERKDDGSKVKAKDVVKGLLGLH